MPTKVTFSGGKKIEALFKNAGKGGVKSVDVGVFLSAKYLDGTPVALVAVVNEFGSRKKGIPERPAFRSANLLNRKDLVNIIKKNVDPGKMIIDQRLAGKIGAAHQAATQKSIVALKSPPNKPSTLRAKRPKANPLVNTGTEVGSITFKVNK